MTAVRLVGRYRDYRDLHLAVVDDVRDWPATIELPPPGFVVLTTHDTRKRSEQEIRRFARRLLDQGCAWACCWGPDADRMELAFDLEQIDVEERGYTQPEFVVTTAHGDESLDEAIWFAIFNADPADIECRSVLVVTEPQWEEQVEARLLDPEKLWDQVPGDEGAAE